MPRGPNGQKRPVDVIGNAVHIARIATGEVEDTTVKASSRERGLAGAKARQENTTAEERSDIARRAAAARWQ